MEKARLLCAGFVACPLAPLEHWGHLVGCLRRWRFVLLLGRLEMALAERLFPQVRKRSVVTTGANQLQPPMLDRIFQGEWECLVADMWAVPPPPLL